jgi:hypothetical protein
MNHRRASQSLVKHIEQMPHFFLQLDRAGNGLRDFLAYQFAIPLAQPVNEHGHG